MKRLFSILLVFSMIFSSVPAAWGAAQQTFYGTSSANQLYGSLMRSDVKNHWAKNSVYKMAALGVVKGYNDRYLPNAHVSKQQAVTMIENLMGKPAVPTGLTAAQLTNRDLWADGFLNAALQDGVITQQELNTVTWKQNATREEVAYWVAKAMGLGPIYGQDAQAVRGFRDSSQFDQAKAPYCEAILVEKIMSGSGDNLFKPKAAVQRGELCSILDKAAETIMPKRKIQIVDASVIYVDKALSLAGGTPSTGRTTVHLVSADGGTRYAIARDGTTSSPRDILIVKNGSPGLINNLAMGDHVKLYVQENGTVVWGEVEGAGSSAMYATLESVDMGRRTMNVKTTDNQRLTLAVSPNYSVMLDEYPATLADLIGGQSVTLLMKGNQVSQIRSTGAYLYPADSYQATTTENGTITARTASRLTVRGDYGNYTDYNITPQTVFVRLSRTVTWQDLADGDYVKLSINSANQVVRAEVTALNNSVTAVYKAKLQSVDTGMAKLAFTDVAKYSHGEWQTPSSYVSLPITQSAEISDALHQITLTDLKASYNGYYCYFSTTSAYGTETISKLAVKTDEEKKYSGKIVTISNSLNSISVDQVSSELKYDQGTIVIKDNKLVAPSSVGNGMQGVFYTNEVDKSKKVKVLMVESVTAPTLAVYKGRISKVRNDYFVIDSFATLANNKFDTDRGTSSEYNFYLTSETGYLNGIVSTNVYSPTRTGFTNAGLMGTYDSGYAYVIANGTDALAVNVTAKVYGSGISTREYTGERVTVGEVSSVSGSAVTLTKVKNWDSYLEQWSLADGTTTIDFTPGLVVKSKQVTAPANLKTGDSLYLVRSGMKGLLGICQ